MRKQIAFPAKHALAAAFVYSIAATAFAADVTVQPASGSGFVIKDASGASERLRVQENGAITLPGITGAAAQTQPVCVGSAGLLGLCSSQSGAAYGAGTGLALNGATFSIAPGYQLPQACAANQLAQWNGTAWNCATVGATSLPAGTANQTLRYDSGNVLVAASDLQVMSDGGVLATNAAINAAFAAIIAGGTTPPTGKVPASGAGARMMWYPAKGAFRAGYTGTEWDDVNIGYFSTAIGTGTIASGYMSTAMGNGTIANGTSSVAMGNITSASGISSTAMGDHTKASGFFSIAMGSSTTASGNTSTAMGSLTNATGSSSTSMGVQTSASGNSSTAMGNLTSASADYSTAMGYSTSANGISSVAMGNNTTAGADNSFAMGTNAVVTAGSSGAFVYGDGTATVKNEYKNQFMVLASSNTVFYSGTNNGGAQSTWPGVVLQTGAGAWSSLSDRSAKSDFASVDARAVLDRVITLPMTTWRYNGQDKSTRHIGPIAQDFYAAFNVGEDERHISTVDADGVALAAIQGLNAKLIESDAKTSLLLNEKNHEIAELRRQISAMRDDLQAQRQRVVQLESRSDEIAVLKAAVARLQGQAPAVAIAGVEP